MAPSPDQIAIVKSTAPIIKEHGTVITSVFYRNLLKDHPALFNYFSIRNQKTGAQQTALAGAVLAYATYIDNLAVLSNAVEKIAHKHVSLFVKPEHYPIVGHYLLGAFGEVLGDQLTPEIKGAWLEAYNQLAQVFIDAEKNLYEAAGNWRGWRAFNISNKVAETEGVASLYLTPSDGQPIPTFTPGQYVSVQVSLPSLDGLLQSRQFSLSEAPDESKGHYRITVKEENFGGKYSEEEMQSGGSPGLVSGILHSLPTGAEIELSPPRGVFKLDESVKSSNAPVVLISAGVGATPLMSILQTVLQQGNSRPVVWTHGSRTAKGVCYGKYVREAAQGHPNLTTKVFVKQVVSGDVAGRDYDCEGRLDLGVLKQQNALYLEESSAHYYICGPEGFMLEARASLLGYGVKEDRIFQELFCVGSL